jgi:NAD(P)H-dependent flavin oxidoreductase YrpB (nitropropane dioxygenase family)
VAGGALTKLHTRLTEILGIDHPIISAPMAFAAGGKLAAAVTAAGGLGLIGGGYGDAKWLEREFSEAHRTVLRGASPKFGNISNWGQRIRAFFSAASAKREYGDLVAGADNAVVVSFFDAVSRERLYPRLVG